jgi:HTH-type transcriptional regulator / antitoxin HigA
MVMALTKEYQRLIRSFPLLPIRSDEDMEAAMVVMSDLLTRQGVLAPMESGYLSVLQRLVDDYEDRHPEVQAFRAAVANVTPGEALAYLMEQGNITQTQLAREIGCKQSVISAMVCGKRGVSKVLARRLSERFNVAIDLFLP